MAGAFRFLVGTLVLNRASSPSAKPPPPSVIWAEIADRHSEFGAIARVQAAEGGNR